MRTHPTSTNAEPERLASDDARGGVAAPEALELLGYIARHSANLGDAIRRFIHYSALLDAAGELSLHCEGGEAALVVRAHPDDELDPRDVEFAFIALRRTAEELCSWPPPSLEVELAAGRTPHHGALEASLGCEVRFGCRDNRMVFAEDYLARPIPGHDRRLREILEREARELLGRQGPADGIIREISHLVARELDGGNSNSDHVAEILGISVRTMNRRLRRAGTTYKAVVDGVRMDLTSRYLGQTEMGIGEVAFALGFADASSFNRAFRRWTGTTPGAYRSTMRRQQPPVRTAAVMDVLEVGR